jgi:hypothetical protein
MVKGRNKADKTEGEGIWEDEGAGIELPVHQFSGYRP